MSVSRNRCVSESYVTMIRMVIVGSCLFLGWKSHDVSWKVNGFVQQPSLIGRNHDEYNSSNRKTILSLSLDDDNEDSKEKKKENIRRSIAHLMDSLVQEDSQTTNDDETTMVHIVGSGICGTLESLPLSTLSILSRADVVLYDSLSLSTDQLNEIVPSHCLLESVGKRGGNQRSMKQSDIDELLFQYATRPNYKTIVRLKGGDPMLFGRTQTEVQTLQQQSKPYQIIPGISSCIAGPHYAGIPLTDPKLNCQSFAVYSGTNPFGIGIGGSNDQQTTQLLQNRVRLSQKVVDTLVFLMIGNLDKLQTLCQTLTTTTTRDDAHPSDAWDDHTPCAVVQNAGRKSQKDWRGTLSTIVSVIQQELPNATSVSPAIFIVGPTTTLDLRNKN